MKKRYRIFWLCVMFAYMFFCYGAINNTMSDRNYHAKWYNCEQLMPLYPQKTLPEATEKYINSCDPVILARWRDAGGLLWPYQREMLAYIDAYMQRYYWHYVALLIFVLGALPMLALGIHERWLSLREKWERRGRRR